jgi:hypothetical protein
MRRGWVFGQLPLTTHQDRIETRRSGDPDASADITRTQQANAVPVGDPIAGERAAGQDCLQPVKFGG